MKHKFKVNNNNIYLTYCCCKQSHQRFSFAGRPPVMQHSVTIILLLITSMLSTAMAQSLVNSTRQIDCKTLTTSPLSYQLYDFERYNMSQLKYNEFIQKCKSHSNDDNLNDLIFSHQSHLLAFNAANSADTHADLNFFVFDFRVIKNEIVYVDFLNFVMYAKNLNTTVNDTDDFSHKSSETTCIQTDLILYFATQQFTLFKLLNVPSEPSRCLQSITVLLHGKSQLNFLQKKGNTTIPVNVINSPLYYRFDNIETESIELDSRTYCK